MQFIVLQSDINSRAGSVIIVFARHTLLKSEDKKLLYQTACNYYSMVESIMMST